MTCVQCGMHYPKMFRYVEHLKRKGPNHNDQCTQCDLTLQSHEEYKIHIQTDHDGKWLHRCGFCEAKFDELVSLKSHHATHHTAKRRAKQLKARGSCPTYKTGPKQV